MVDVVNGRGLVTECWVIGVGLVSECVNIKTVWLMGCGHWDGCAH